jgi:large subunit ribosomal protein L18
MDKKAKRLRRAKKARAKIALQGVCRLAVHRTPRHIYAQVISPDASSVIASASTVQKDVRSTLSATSNKEAAATVGKLIAERAKAAGVDRVAFDRSGFKYHGRVQALADAAREAGLDL